jgi:predicted transcriptional regulator
MAAKKVDESADTGRFVTKEEIKRHPKTTFTETTKPAKKK